MFKSGDYDLDYEEHALNELIKKIGNVDVDEIEKLTHYLGITGAFKKYNELGPSIL